MSEGNLRPRSFLVPVGGNAVLIATAAVGSVRLYIRPQHPTTLWHPNPTDRSRLTIGTVITPRSLSRPVLTADYSRSYRCQFAHPVRKLSLSQPPTSSPSRRFTPSVKTNHVLSAQPTTRRERLGDDFGCLCRKIVPLPNVALFAAHQRICRDALPGGAEIVWSISVAATAASEWGYGVVTGTRTKRPDLVDAVLGKAPTSTPRASSAKDPERFYHTRSCLDSRKPRDRRRTISRQKPPS